MPFLVCCVYMCGCVCVDVYPQERVDEMEREFGEEKRERCHVGCRPPTLGHQTPVTGIDIQDTVHKVYGFHGLSRMHPLPFSCGTLG